MSPAVTEIKSVVREKYGAIARSAGKGCGYAPGCCADGSLDMIGDAYAGIDGHVADADLGLGCGLPTQHAGIREGDVVLDLGAGAGNDAFIARRLVGEPGRVIGLDMTEAMVERARTNAQKLGYSNVEFRPGEIEDMPVEDAAVDVVISNCVLNLVPDKSRAFFETFRVLKPGGHFCVSDIVATGPLPDGIRSAAALYVGCVAGAIPEADYLDVIRRAGFEAVRVVERKPIPLPDEALREHLSDGELQEFRSGGVQLLSVTVLGTKPEQPSIAPLSASSAPARSCREEWCG
jgi:arsenite methyltransferase